MYKILYFTHNVMAKLPSVQTNKSDIPEKTIADNEIYFDFVENSTNFLFWPCTNGGRLGFHSQCKV